jgi:hypothetical protein
MREVTILYSILGCDLIIVEFSTELGNSSQSLVNIPGAPPEVTQQLVILTPGPEGLRPELPLLELGLHASGRTEFGLLKLRAGVRTPTGLKRSK